MESPRKSSSLEAAYIIHDDNGKIYFVNEALLQTCLDMTKTFEQMHIRSLHPANYESTRKEIYEIFRRMVCEVGSTVCQSEW